MPVRLLPFVPAPRPGNRAAPSIVAGTTGLDRPRAACPSCRAGRLSAFPSLVCPVRRPCPVRGAALLSYTRQPPRECRHVQIKPQRPHLPCQTLPRRAAPLPPARPCPCLRPDRPAAPARRGKQRRGGGDRSLGISRLHRFKDRQRR